MNKFDIKSLPDWVQKMIYSKARMDISNDLELGPMTQASIRLKEETVTKLKSLAESKKMGYTTYIREVLEGHTK